MKMAMTALAVVFLAQAAPALAAPDIDDADVAQRPEPRARFEHEGRSERPRWQAPEAARPAIPPPPPQARDVDRPYQHDPGNSIGRPGPWVHDGGRTEPREDHARDRGDQGRPHGNGDRARGWDRHRDDGNRHDSGRRDWDRRDGDHRNGDHRDWDRRGRDDHRYDHDRWNRDRYPPVYRSHQRYRHDWRPPTGFYSRAWGFGDYLPRSWYGGDYWIVDAGRYHLPLPPPGFDWVRVGDDAVLVDRFNGRVVQVVRFVFW